MNPWLLVMVSLKMTCIVYLATNIDTNNQRIFSVIDAILLFCVLYFILDTSLFNEFFTNRAKSVILFYTEVFFINFLLVNFLYLNYTGSSLQELIKLP